MKVFKTINHNPDLSLALGYFDGVHVAHQKVIAAAVEFAKANSKKSAVVTFDMNPANYFRKDKIQNISTNEERLERMEYLGVDYVYMLDFEEFMYMSASEYLQDVLVKSFEPNCIVTGFNHKFGKAHQGDTSLLPKCADRYNYKYIEIPVHKVQSCLVSSSNIRDMVENGHIRNANLLLGHSFSIRNNVVKGDMRARKLGYPTANIFWPNNVVHLPHGVYFGYATVDKTYPAVINWGVKPTFGEDNEEILEVHILNFDATIYGKIIKASFLMKIREEQKFADMESLRKQIAQDVETVRKLARLS